MTHLVIEYLLEGSRPGYTFLPPTDGFDAQILKTVWRQAMPRGQGWGNYTGARSLKTFPVTSQIVGISEVQVTNRQDEHGRRGIRRAVITLLPVWKFEDFIRERLAELPVGEQEQPPHKLTLARWMKMVEQALPKLGRKNPQIILAHPYHSVGQWQQMEALALTLALSWKVRLLNRGKPITALTTLALTNREEGWLVMLPREEARQLKGAKIVYLD